MASRGGSGGDPPSAGRPGPWNRGRWLPLDAVAGAETGAGVVDLKRGRRAGGAVTRALPVLASCRSQLATCPPGRVGGARPRWSPLGNRRFGDTVSGRETARCVPLSAARLCGAASARRSVAEGSSSARASRTARCGRVRRCCRRDAPVVQSATRSPPIASAASVTFLLSARLCRAHLGVVNGAVTCRDKLLWRRHSADEPARRK